LVFDDLPDCVPLNECDMEVFAAQFKQLANDYAKTFERKFRAKGLESVQCRAQTEGSSTSRQSPGFIFAIVGVVIIWLVK
jgi:hypothetical protein